MRPSVSGSQPPATAVGFFLVEPSPSHGRSARHPASHGTSWKASRMAYPIYAVLFICLTLVLGACDAATNQSAGQEPSRSTSGRPSAQHHYLVEYSLENGTYSANRVTGTKDKCEQIAVESEGIYPDSQFVCQRDISGEFNDRYGTAFRVDDRYFVAGTTRNGKKKGALVTKADVETIVEFAECTWTAPELMTQLTWTDDQDVDDTVRRFLSVVPFQPNFVRDARLNMKLFC